MTRGWTLVTGAPRGILGINRREPAALCSSETSKRNRGKQTKRCARIDHAVLSHRGNSSLFLSNRTACGFPRKTAFTREPIETEKVNSPVSGRCRAAVSPPAYRQRIRLCRSTAEFYEPPLSIRRSSIVDA